MKLKRYLIYILTIPMLFLFASCKERQTIETNDLRVSTVENRIIIENESNKAYTVKIYYNEELSQTTKLVTNGGIQYVMENNGTYRIEANAKDRKYQYVYTNKIDY